MNILVCVKQVPDTAEIKIDPVKNTLIRDGVQSIVNPFDMYAVEAALRIKEGSADSQVTVITMGPPQAKSALTECMALGCDHAYLISDSAFGGADTLATSYTLSKVIEKLAGENGAFDMVFCGKQAIDGDTAQVGPEIAEQLGLPQVTGAVSLSLENDAAEVKRETERGYEVLRCTLPLLVTFTKSEFDIRIPSLRDKLAAKRKQINVLTAADIELDRGCVGLTGSPTRVKRSYTAGAGVKEGCVPVPDSETAAEAAAEWIVRAINL